MNWIYLSYFLNHEAPAYGGGSAFKAEQDKQISEGDSCNTSNWDMSNHMGTHLDFPRHFSPSGKVLDAYSPAFFIFQGIHVADMRSVGPGQIIHPNDLSLPGKGRNDIDMLIIRTGWSRFRNQPVYWQKNPGFHPDLAEYIRGELPNVRIMGFDAISLSSFANRFLGRLAHKAFLDHERPILPLEDMDLTRLGAGDNIGMIVVSPLQVSQANGAPCTVFAQVEEGVQK